MWCQQDDITWGPAAVLSIRLLNRPTVDRNSFTDLNYVPALSVIFANMLCHSGLHCPAMLATLPDTAAVRRPQAAGQLDFKLPRHNSETRW